MYLKNTEKFKLVKNMKILQIYFLVFVILLTISDVFTLPVNKKKCLGYKNKKGLKIKHPRIAPMGGYIGFIKPKYECE